MSCLNDTRTMSNSLIGRSSETCEEKVSTRWNATAERAYLLDKPVKGSHWSPIRGNSSDWRPKWSASPLPRDIA